MCMVLDFKFCIIFLDEYFDGLLMFKSNWLYNIFFMSELMSDINNYV